MNFSVLYYVVLGSEEGRVPRFDTEADAKAYADEHGGDAYPVVDVGVTTVEPRVLDVEADE